MTAVTICMKVTAVFSYCSSFRKVAGILRGQGVQWSRVQVKSHTLEALNPRINVFTTKLSKNHIFNDR